MAGSAMSVNGLVSGTDGAPALPGHGGPSIIDVRGLTRRFGPHVAVDDVTFSVARGEVFGFLGRTARGRVRPHPDALRHPSTE